ncbi:MAG: nucleotidyltransferase family protein [Acidobacteriota bacterium]
MDAHSTAVTILTELDQTARGVAIGQFLAEMTYREAKQILGPAGIDVLVLKGPHLGNTVYDSPAERPYCDLDLLVRPRDHRKAIELLTQGRFTLADWDPARLATERTYYNRALRSRFGVLVELHRDLAGHARYPVDVDALFSRAESFRFGETDARGLGTEDLLCHLCLHITKTYFWLVQPKHLEDIRLLVGRRTIDWEVLSERIEQTRCRVGSYYCFMSASEKLGVDVPRWVLEALRPGPVRRWWLERFIDWRNWPSYKYPAHSSAQVQWRVGIPLIDRVKDWVPFTLTYASIRLKDAACRLR